jgi:hypothetical protein
VAISCCNGREKSILSFCEDFRGPISLSVALFCARPDGHSDSGPRRPFGAQNDLFQRLRQRLAAECAKVSPFKGELEADESYFGARRVRGRRGRGAAGKTIVFGLLKRGDQVYTEIVPNASKAALQAVIHTDKWRGYDGLVDLGFEKHRESTMATTSLPSVPTTSTVSRVSGAIPKLDWPSSMACAGRLSPCI